MVLFLALTAAIGCAIFNGTAAILEKIGAGQEKKVRSSHPGLLWRLRNSPSYLLGITLDLLAWVLTILAVHSLPLFVVQPIIACSVIISVMIEHYVFKRRLTMGFIVSIATILAGLVLLALVATPEQAAVIAPITKWAIILTPLGLVAIGSLFSTIEKRYATFILAAISGLAFGGVSIAGRALIFSHPYTHLISNPLLWATGIYGLLGILFFTIALQRAAASAVNATMIACETLVPICAGLFLLGDHPRDNLWVVVALGIICTLVGTMSIALRAEDG